MLVKLRVGVTAVTLHYVREETAFKSFMDCKSHMYLSTIYNYSLSICGFMFVDVDAELERISSQFCLDT